MYSTTTRFILVCLVLGTIAQTEDWIPSLMNTYVEPDYVMSEDGHLETTLIIDKCTYDDHITFNTRCYNGSIPGPTFKVKPGDVITLTLINDLEEEWHAWEENFPHWPNTTTMHIHGLHMSPYEDDVFEVIGPGENFTFTYHIPHDHYPGTHWYHAHYHGSSSYQIAGGLHGAFLIEAPDDEPLPDFINDMTWHVMVLTNFKMMSYDNGGWHGYIEWSRGIGDEMPMELSMTDEFDNTFIVNGKYHPVISLDLNEWGYFQLINAGATLTLELVISDTESCDFYAVAFDGIYLTEPRLLNTTYIPSGARADIIIRCTEPGVYSVYNLPESDAIWLYDGIDRYDEDELFFLNISNDYVDSNDTDAYEEPEKPEYLSDLYDLPDDAITDVYTIETNFIDPDDDQFAINGEVWINETTYLYEMELGGIYEFVFASDWAPHPMHIHINHMQVVSDVVSNDTVSTFALYEQGEWRDAIMATYYRNVTVRTRPVDFTGTVVVHCHYVMHADKGMMAVFYVGDGETDYQQFLDELDSESSPDEESWDSESEFMIPGN